MPANRQKARDGTRSEIKGAFGLFDGSAFDDVGVDHGGPNVAVTQQFLNGSDVVVGFQQMGGEAVAEGVGGDAFENLRFSDDGFEGSLNIPLMEVVSPALFGFRYGRQSLRGEKPLPDEVFCAVFVFFLQLFGKKGAVVSLVDILLVKVCDAIPVGQKVRPEGVGDGDGTVLFSFSVVDRQDGLDEVEILNPQLKAFKEAESAAVK